MWTVYKLLYRTVLLYALYCPTSVLCVGCNRWCCGAIFPVLFSIPAAGKTWGQKAICRIWPGKHKSIEMTSIRLLLGQVLFMKDQQSLQGQEEQHLVFGWHQFYFTVYILPAKIYLWLWRKPHALVQLFVSVWQWNSEACKHRQWVQ